MAQSIFMVGLSFFTQLDAMHAGGGIKIVHSVFHDRDIVGNVPHFVRASRFTLQYEANGKPFRQSRRTKDDYETNVSIGEHIVRLPK